MIKLSCTSTSNRASNDRRRWRGAFLDSVAICEKRHYGLMLWKDDHDNFKTCKSCKEINEVQKEAHRKIIGIVGTYISLQFQRWQDRDVIWAPYNFR